MKTEQIRSVQFVVQNPEDLPPDWLLTIEMPEASGVVVLHNGVESRTWLAVNPDRALEFVVTRWTKDPASREWPDLELDPVTLRPLVRVVFGDFSVHPVIRVSHG